ncbi:MAG: hypothetical protein AAF579_11460 [Cyanobacteria bacterium P01_C01_bin.118]
MWDADGNLLKTLKGHKDDVVGVKFSPDQKFLVSISADRTAKLWHLTHSNALKTLTSDFGDIESWHRISNFINFSPEGKVFTTIKAISNSEKDSSIQLWRMDGTPAKQLTTTRDIYSSSQHSIFSEDGQRLVVLGDNASTLFQSNGKLISRLLETDRAVVTFSPDNQWIVTAEQNGPVRLWQAETGIRAITLAKSSKGDVDVRFSHDSSLITASDEEGAVKLWTIDGDLLTTLPNNNGDTPTEVVFSPDSQLFATVVNPSGYGSDSYGPVKLWQRDGTPIGDALIEKTDHTTLRQESHKVITEFSADSQTLVTRLSKGDMSGPIQLWGIDGTLIKDLVAETDAFADFQVSPEGSTILTYQDEGPVILWKTNGNKVNELTNEGQDYQSVQFSPNGQVLALLSQDALQIWDGVTGKLIKKIEHPAAFKTLAFSANSQLLSVSTTDNLVHIWKQTKPQVLTTVAGHTDQVDFLDFSADNKQLLTVSKNETVIRRLNELKDLKTLTDRACRRVQAYLVTHPKELEKLKICQTDAIKTAAAPAWERLGDSLLAEGNEKAALKAFHKADQWQKFGLTPREKAKKASLIEQSKELAAKGQVKEAMSKFNQALKLDPMDPRLNFESESRANKLAAEALVKEGEDLVAADDMSAAIQKFEQALELSPDSLRTAADSHANQVMALLLLEKFKNLIWQGEEEEEFSEAIKLQSKINDLAPDLMTYVEYAIFCFKGSLYGHTEKVLGFCNQAVVITPDFEKHIARAFRGIARAQTGNMEGALADWEFFLKIYNEDDPDNYADYLNSAFGNASDWVETLKKGENPFVPDVLAELKEFF